MEKRGIVQPGITPPETEGEKQASAEQLEQHPTKRLSDAAADRFTDTVIPQPPKAASPPDVQCKRPRC
jgi:hypothetical protein